MPNTPILSIVLIVHDQHEYLESTLTSIYENIDFNFELFIVDDASTDESKEIIRSIIEYQDHADTFYFEQEEPSGYGIRLQQVFAQISADLLWIPGMLTELDGQKLAVSIEHLTETGQPLGLSEPVTLPESAEEWINMISVGKWAGNHHFLWNLTELPEPECYFQPRLNRFHGLELALRTTYTKSVASIPSFSRMASRPPFEQPDSYERRELLTSLIQFRGISATYHELAGQILFETKSEDDVKHLDESKIENHLSKAQKLIKSGEVATALHTINRVLSSDRKNQEALGLKISVLEKMKRYVEASELKFQLKDLQNEPGFQQEFVDEDTDTHDLSTGDDTGDASKSDIDNIEPQFEKEKAASQEKEPEEEHQEANQSDTDNELKGDKKKQPEPKVTPDTDTQKPKADENINSKIKKDIQQLEKKEPVLQLDGLSGPKISIIIPTTLDGKPFLEQCLMTVARECNAEYTELIIIDNASLDDTYAYLNQLKEDQFFNCTVITNNTNVGFATACNQGLKAAKGQYACLMHNDVMLETRTIDEMAAQLDAHPDIAILGPKTNYSVQPRQLPQSDDATGSTIDYVTYVGSFCMMIRKSADLRLDEQFNPAFFGDIDLCLQAAETGWKIGIYNDTEVEHQGGITTEQLGLFREGEFYWLNAKNFQEKWNMQPELPARVENAEESVEQLCYIADLVNPYHPEQNLLNRINELLDDETFARIQKLKFDDSQLLPLITIMMVANERQLLRRLEDQLEAGDVPVDLALKLVYFYYKRNIYSRCHHYLDQIPEAASLLQASLFRLKIAIGERNMKAAIELLNSLMEEYPSNVLLLKAAGDIHSFSGDEKEADKFLKMAKEAAPFLFNKEKYLL